MPTLERVTPSSKRFEIPKAVVGEELDGEMVLLNLDTGIYFGLNRVGTELWRELGEHGDLDAAISKLEARYRNVDPQTIRKDAETLMQELNSKGLLTASQP